MMKWRIIAVEGYQGALGDLSQDLHIVEKQVFVLVPEDS